MTHRFPTTLALLALAFASPASSLERLERPAVDQDHGVADQWSSGCINTIAYYNFCNGWAWAVDRLEPNEKIGVLYHTQECTDTYSLYASWHYAYVGPPAGYGYTGTMSVQLADAQGCPSTPLRGVPFLPATGWNNLLWNLPLTSGRFVLVWTNGPTDGSPLTWMTDHPAAGPTGPAACGRCFPSDRETRSFRFGTPEAPHCPGLPFDDPSVCSPELDWDIDGTFVPWGTVSVEAQSWGSVKALYR